MTPELSIALEKLKFAVGHVRGLAEAVELVSAALSQAEAYRVDAERYRFIRAHSRSELFDMGIDLSWYCEQEGLDEAIDAARKLA